MISIMEHQRKVSGIARALRSRKETTPVSLGKKQVSHQVPNPRDRRYDDEKINIGDLDEIIEIDTEAMTCTAEPGVTFSQLVEATMKYGLAPMIVPEFRTITIGGAVAGSSLESMSFRFGGFHDTCIRYQVITARGDVLECSRDGENQLLFEMMHGTFGTLGIISLLAFRLIPAKRFVEVTFERYGGLHDFLNGIESHFNEKDIDFMDAFIHSPDNLVINAGNFADKAPYTNDYDWMKVFYKESRKRKKDHLYTPDYYFRYDNGVTHVKPLPFRFIVGNFMSSNESLRLAERFRRIIPDAGIPFTVDVFIPFSEAVEFLDWYHDMLGHYPLWCVPYRRKEYPWIKDSFAQRSHDELFLDLAVYGMRKGPDHENYHRALEKKLFEIGGLKTLISRNYYTRSRFWEIWNRTNYMKVKRITDPENIFRDLYTKMCRTSMGKDP